MPISSLLTPFYLQSALVLLIGSPICWNFGSWLFNLIPLFMACIVLLGRVCYESIPVNKNSALFLASAPSVVGYGLLCQAPDSPHVWIAFSELQVECFWRTGRRWGWEAGSDLDYERIWIYNQSLEKKVWGLEHMGTMSKGLAQHLAHGKVFYRSERVRPWIGLLLCKFDLR